MFDIGSVVGHLVLDSKDFEKGLNNATKTLNKISLGILAAAGASLKFAADIEKQKVALKVLTGSVDVANKVFKEWQTFAASTPFQLEEITQAGKMLLAFGETADNVTNVLRRIGDVAAGINAPMSEIAELYGKMRVQNTLYAQDLNQMAGRGIPVFTELAKVLGISQDKVKEFASTGQLKFAALEQAFINMTAEGSKFGGMMDEISQTTAGRFSTVLDNLQLSAAKFGEALLPVVNDLMDGINNLLGIFDDLDAQTKELIISLGGVILVTTGIVNGINLISKAFIAMKAANPWIFLGIAGIAGLVALIDALHVSQREAAALKDQFAENKTETDKLLNSYKNMSKSNTLTQTQLDELIKTYPKLKGELIAYKTTIGETADKVNDLRMEEGKRIIENLTNYKKVLSLQGGLIQNERELAQQVAAGTLRQSSMDAILKQKKEELIQVTKDLNKEIYSMGIQIDTVGNKGLKFKLMKDDIDQVKSSVDSLNTATNQTVQAFVDAEDAMTRSQWLQHIEEIAQKNKQATTEIQGNWFQVFATLKANLDTMKAQFGASSWEYKEAWQEMCEHMQNGIDEVASHVMNVLNSITGIFSQMYQNQLTASDNRYKREKKNIENSTMSEEKKKEKLAALEDKYQKEQAKLKKKQFEMNKKASFIETTINVATAVTKALTAGPIIGPILAGMIGALGAVQLGLIASQPTPEFAKGGIATPGLAIVGEEGPELVNMRSTSRIFPADETRGILGGGGVSINMTFTGDINSDVDIQRAMESAGRRFKALQRGA